ncbi:nucleoside triphosphate pyrophosphohydrolase [Radiobacillus sp. PE A8.2]|uniref:nucleoside triphosphate pyrophosphohydrolase n=1 Tax=Radiobacillus sp. PE A8.2 TaxID=3380349 RepID=UPI00388DA2FB
MTNKIEVIGLGAGDLNQLPLGIYRKLTRSNKAIHVRTIDHPVVTSLTDEGVSFIAYDSIYEENQSFEVVYEQIVQQLIKAAEQEDIIYAVPGHPMLAEKTVQLLLEQQAVTIDITGGQSYLDALFTSLRVDPIDGFQFVDGTSFKRNQLNYQNHIIFCQVYDAFVASEVKLALLEDLPPEHLVTIAEAVGSDEEKLKTIPLVELDQFGELNNLTSIYIPPVSTEDLNHQFFRLREVIADLRGPDGCPWDKKQTHQSLRKYLIEEAYEFIDAVDELDDEGMIEEIGDVLLQVMLHSQIGEDEGFFTVDDVIKSITDKMIRRHPHVFGNELANTAEDVLVNWEQIKKQEKGSSPKSLLDNIPKSLPQLLIAEEIQKQAAKVGFDWDDPAPIWDKIIEELDEVKLAINNGNKSEIESELGDVLFAIVNLTRYYKVNPELAIRQTNQKFKRRFTYMEQEIKKNQVEMNDLTLEQLDEYWNQAKRLE